MYGDKWWGYQHASGFVMVLPQDPRYDSWITGTPRRAIIKVVGPFTEDLADEFEGDIKMVRRKIMAALYEKPLEELLNEPS